MSDNRLTATRWTVLQMLQIGFEGYLTLEMRNQGGDSLVIMPGMPICKIVFDWLDEPTEQAFTTCASSHIERNGRAAWL